MGRSGRSLGRRLARGGGREASANRPVATGRGPGHGGARRGRRLGGWTVAGLGGPLPGGGDGRAGPPCCRARVRSTQRELSRCRDRHRRGLVWLVLGRLSASVSVSMRACARARSCASSHTLAIPSPTVVVVVGSEQKRQEAFIRRSLFGALGAAAVSGRGGGVTLLARICERECVARHSLSHVTHALSQISLITSHSELPYYTAPPSACACGLVAPYYAFTGLTYGAYALFYPCAMRSILGLDTRAFRL